MTRIFDFKFYMDRLERRGYDREVCRVLINGGFQSPQALESAETFLPLQQALVDKGYRVDFTGMDEEHSLLKFQATKLTEGRVCLSPVTYELVDSADYRSLFRVNEKLEDLKEPPFLVMKKNGSDTPVAEAATKEQLLQVLLEQGRKSLTIQRYKGLGEMNPQQLWETTMDPEKRTLLQVKLEDAVAAEDVFTVLMGENVETRREFIRSHALEVSNLDV
jgi:DNA gyrase subunit B